MNVLLSEHPVLFCGESPVRMTRVLFPELRKPGGIATMNGSPSEE